MEFYHIENEQPLNQNTCVFSVILNASHSVYPGHFPEQPIAPGVMMVKMITELAGKFLQKKLQLKEASNIKFLQLIIPQKTPKLEVEISVLSAENEVNIKATVKAGEEKYLTLSGSFSILNPAVHGD